MSTTQATVTTTRTVTYPSTTLRALPAFRFDVPVGWTVEEAARTLCVARAPEPVDGFHVNVVIGSSRVRRDVNLREVALASLASLAKQGDALRIESQKVGRFGDRPTYLRAVSLTTREAEPRRLAQVFAMFFAPSAPGRSVVDLITVAGTCLEAQAPTYAPVFVKAIGSFAFDA